MANKKNYPIEIGVGRPKGVPNLVTTRIKEAFAHLLDHNLYRIQMDLEELTPKERLDVIMKLAEYILPKLSRVQADINGNVDSNIKTLVIQTASSVNTNQEQTIIIPEQPSNDSE